MKTVYIEYLLLDNLIMNYLIIFIAARCLCNKIIIWRIALAAGIGAIYTIFYFMPEFCFLQMFIFKILLSFLMTLVGISFKKGLLPFIKAISVFYFTTFMFGGILLGLDYFFNQELMIYNGMFFIIDFSLCKMIVYILIAIILLRYFWIWIKRYFQYDKLLVKINIQFDDLTKNITALLDTGNRLFDPITKSPVIIVEFIKIIDIFPEEMQRLFTLILENDVSLISDALSYSKWISKIRFIPFNSLGKENGMIPGFKPSRMSVLQNNEWLEIHDVIIGVSMNCLSKAGEYEALMHPDILI